MNYYLLWRFVKWVVLMIWGAGLLNLLQASTKKRALEALNWIVVGFAGTWMMGWLMMKLTDQSMGLSWISSAMSFSLLSLVASFQSAHFRRLEKVAKIVAVTTFFVSIGTMVFRSPEMTQIGLAVAALLGVGVGQLFVQESADDVQSKQVFQSFKWIAWAEGCTVLALFGLFMPSKYILDINIDFGTGVIGWTHGVFVIIYLLSLGYTKICLKWSWLDFVMGGLSSFFPGGTFWFEKKMEKKSFSDIPN